MTLKEAREKRGLTQREVAQRVGIAERQYQKYEYGTVPAADTACKIVKVLKTTVERIWGGGEC